VDGIWWDGPWGESGKPPRHHHEQERLHNERPKESAPGADTDAGQPVVIERHLKWPATARLTRLNGGRAAVGRLFRGVLGNCFLAPLYRCVDPHRRVTPNDRGVSGLSGRYHRVSRLPNAFCVPTTASGETHPDQGTCEYEPHVSPPGHRFRIAARAGGPPWVAHSQFLGPGSEAAVTLLTPPGV